MKTINFLLCHKQPRYFKFWVKYVLWKYMQDSNTTQ